MLSETEYVVGSIEIGTPSFPFGGGVRKSSEPEWKEGHGSNAPRMEIRWFVFYWFYVGRDGVSR